MGTMQKLHLVLIPLMSPSHIIPLIGFAKLPSQRGATISIITTPSNAKTYASAMPSPDSEIRLISVPFPGEEAGLPPNCENMDSLPSLDLFCEFFRASELLRRPLEAILSELLPKPSCIVSTLALPWAQDIADALGVPHYVFQTVSCFSSIRSREIKDQLTRSTVARSSESELSEILKRIRESQILARGTLINSFEELEPWYASEYKKHIKTNAWCVGPVSVHDEPGRDRSECLAWLDSMKQNSVVYTCFGSLCHLSPSQLMEIGMGLEASESPFIWVIRTLNLTPEVEHWLDFGFEERVRGGKGMVVRGWAPQLEILSHPSVGGFLTHCGWNSTLDGVRAGVPMATFPMFTEQFYNEKLIVDVLNIVERVGAEVGMNTWDEEKKGVMVRREKVKNAVERLMGGGEKWKRAQSFAKLAKEAKEEGGSSFLNVSLFIHDVMSMQQCVET